MGALSQIGKGIAQAVEDVPKNVGRSTSTSPELQEQITAHNRQLAETKAIKDVDSIDPYKEREQASELVDRNIISPDNLNDVVIQRLKSIEAEHEKKYISNRGGPAVVEQDRKDFYDKWGINDPSLEHADTGRRIPAMYLSFMDREFTMLTKELKLPNKAMSLGNLLQADAMTPYARAMWNQRMGNKHIFSETFQGVQNASASSHAKNTITGNTFSLPHEWAHSLDTYLSSIATGGIRKNSNGQLEVDLQRFEKNPQHLLSNHKFVSRISSHIRPELLDAWEEVQSKIQTSMFRAEAQAEDAWVQTAGKPDYWSTRHEMFARAVDSYVRDKRGTPLMPGGVDDPQDKKAIYTALDKFFATLKTDPVETWKGHKTVMLYSATGLPLGLIPIMTKSTTAQQQSKDSVQ